MHGSSIPQLLDLVVGNVNDRGLLSILPVVDILIQVTDFELSLCRIVKDICSFSGFFFFCLCVLGKRREGEVCGI